MLSYLVDMASPSPHMGYTGTVEGGDRTVEGGD